MHEGACDHKVRIWRRTGRGEKNNGEMSQIRSRWNFALHKKEINAEQLKIPEIAVQRD